MPNTILCKTPEDVQPALERLHCLYATVNSGVATDSVTVTYNGINFDCPSIEAAAMKLGVPSFHFDIRKYGSRNIIDLYQELTFGGNDGCQVLARSQKALAAVLGVPVEDDCDGKDIAALVAAGDWDGVQAHNESDIRTLVALYRKRHPKGRGICLDIETIADERAGEFRAFVRPDARLTDPKKIEASIDEKLAKAALDPWLNRIVCIGYEVV